MSKLAKLNDSISMNSTCIFEIKLNWFYLSSVWRYQRGNQNPEIDEQTTQWPNEKGQKDKQRSTKHEHKTKDRVTRTPLKTGGEFRCSGRVGSIWSTVGTRRINLVTNLVISHEWGKKKLFDFKPSGWNIMYISTLMISNKQQKHVYLPGIINHDTGVVVPTKIHFKLNMVNIKYIL
jgi:hypothetical protein